MSQLLEMLNRIDSWVEKNAEFESDMRPGLTLEQIEEKLVGLPYKMPREIIELYTWRNGARNGSFLPDPDGEYGIQEFYSLGEAISVAADWDEHVFPKMNAFPLFSQEGAMYWTVVSDVQQELALIYSCDDGMFPATPDYESFADFLSAIVKRLKC
ncbi:MAG: SMI1/KNR4 family protein [Alkalinema sp. RU_4_3]|nr:SMI1/KNR4 family protein [Alkalinema sp. RU_4_3]